MSVDRRLREGLQVQDPVWDPGTTAAFEAVLAGTRRRTVRRRVATGTAAAVVLVGAVVGPNVLGGSRPARAPEPALGYPTVPHHPPSPAPLDGRWRTGWLTSADVRANLRAHGLARWMPQVEAVVPPGRFRLALRLDGGLLYLRAVPAHGKGGIVDQQRYWVERQGLILYPGFDWHTKATFRWELAGDRLVLRLRDVVPFRKLDMPAEAYERALYLTAPFTRVG